MTNKTVTMSREALKWAVEQLEEDGNKGCGYFDTLSSALTAPIVEADGMGEAFEDWAERELGLPKHRIASGDYQSFGMSCAEKAWKASQRAPVSVVLPNPMEMEAPSADKAPVEIHNSIVTGWNACLDKVKELNQSPSKMCNCNQGRLPCECGK